MLARRGLLTHPIAGDLELPLLVPSFSSKGFSFNTVGRGKGRRQVSEVSTVLERLDIIEPYAALVSAFDIYHNYLKSNNSAPAVPYALRKTNLVIIDSGGYELSPDFDSTEPKKVTLPPNGGFGEKEYRDVLTGLLTDKNDLAFLITNFDHGNDGKSLQQQMTEARELFCNFEGHLNGFIIRPETEGSHIDFKDYSNAKFGDLAGFDVIGVTEKTIGDRPWDRVRAIARLRRGLDDANVTAPIHIWGGLDPVVTPLYFFAGASIFDGVSWLRYVFNNGVAVCREATSVLCEEIGITAQRSFSMHHTASKNVRSLENLALALQQWVDYESKSFDMFGDTKADLERAYKAMITNIKEMKVVSHGR